MSISKRCLSVLTGTDRVDNLKKLHLDVTAKKQKKKNVLCVRKRFSYCESITPLYFTPQELTEKDQKKAQFIFFFLHLTSIVRSTRKPPLALSV